MGCGGSQAMYTDERERALARARERALAESVHHAAIEAAMLSAAEDAAVFATDCKAAAFENALATRGIVRRGHLILDGRLLLEHWWVQRSATVIDPSFVGPRGVRYDMSRRLYMPLPTDAPTDAFDASEWTGCMVSWGECSGSPECEWCAHRRDLVRRFPLLRPGEIVVAETGEVERLRDNVKTLNERLEKSKTELQTMTRRWLEASSDRGTR